MPSVDCLFHFQCAQPAGSDEHVFPAALGGRRTDRRLLCAGCQGWTSKLDEALPEQLRYLNLHLGVVGDHSKKPARISIADADSGRRFLLDEKMNIEGRGNSLLSEHTDETGYTVRRYNFMSKTEERRVLNGLRAKGVKVDVLNRTVAPILRTRPLTLGLAFGGSEGMKAVGRIALNFLAVVEPDAARTPELKPFRQWILSGKPEASEFVNFGGELPAPFQTANHYEFGHRVMIGLDPVDGVFARVTFFDTYDLAIRLGPATPGPRRLYIWDIDPTAQRQQPDVDRLARNLSGTLEYSPRVLGDFAATSAEVYDRVQAGSDRILGAARAKIDQEHVERLCRQLSQLSKTPRERLPEQLQRLLRPELQCATNLVVRVAPLVEREIRKAGYSWTADYLLALMEAQLAEFIVPLSELVLSELGRVLLGLVERNEAAPEQVHDLLFGGTGQHAANAALFRTLERMRIWYKTDGPTGD